MASRNLYRGNKARNLARPALCLLVSLAVAQSATAGGPLGVGVNVGTNVNLPRASAGVGIGAAARTEAAAPDVRAVENSNGQIITGRESGPNRAEERRSEQGAQHQKASDALRRHIERRANQGTAASVDAATRNTAGALTRAAQGGSVDAAANAAADTGAAARR